MLRLGVHVSISGNIYKAIDRAVELGCNTMQIFPRNPRSFKRKVQSQEDLDEFNLRRKKAGIMPLVIHGVYTQNLASSKRGFRNLSVRNFIEDIEFAHKIKADLIVVHPGSFKGTSLKRGIENVASSLDKLLDVLPEGMCLLLENLAGGGSWIGSNFSILGDIAKRVNNKKGLGLCLDTCHVFSAGYDIRSKEGLDKVISQIRQELGLGWVRLVHLNDSLYDLRSHRDRHWHIGQGKIGQESLGRIVNHPELKSLPFILETPKDSIDDDLRNLKRVRDMYKS